MGKVRKTRKHGDPVRKPVVLYDQIQADKYARFKRIKTDVFDDDEKNESELIDDKTSVKILREAKKQQDELFGFTEPKTKKKQHRFPVLFDEEDKSQSEDEMETFHDTGTIINVSKEDEEIIDKFMSNQPEQRATLAEMINDLLNKKEIEVASQLGKDAQAPLLDEKIIALYENVGKILSKYRSGKIPKAFKVLPALKNWEQLLAHTHPENWSAAAMFHATRIFASNLNARLAQRFYNLILLPRVRDDIAEFRRLNHHLFMSLNKALFKPAAFFKGILLPLCESSDCTLREAVLIGSVLARSSIPMLHCAAALYKISEMHYNGANSLFIKILLEKQYALPYRVLNHLVSHFLRFAHETRTLPVLWHQTLLSFVKIYSKDLSLEQKQQLIALTKIQKHYLITPEIRNALNVNVGSENAPTSNEPADETMETNE